MKVLCLPRLPQDDKVSLPLIIHLADGKQEGLEMQVNAGIQEEFGHNYYCLLHIFLELRQQTLTIGTALYFLSKGDFARHFVAMNCDLMKMEILFFISIL